MGLNNNLGQLKEQHRGSHYANATTNLDFLHIVKIHRSCDYM